MWTNTEQRRNSGGDIFRARGDGNNVVSGCRQYAPRGSVGIMRMEDYRMCDSCRHQRTDSRCGYFGGSPSNPSFLN